MSGVHSDFCCAMSLPCPWESEGGWKILISKCRLVSVPPEVGIMWWGGEDGSVPGGGCLCECHQWLWRGCWEERTAVTVGVFACLQVDNDRKDLDTNGKDVDAEKMSRFVRMNELRLVTEYNPVVITNSPQTSPSCLASSSWASSGPRVCTPRHVWGLRQ